MVSYLDWVVVFSSESPCAKGNEQPSNLNTKAGIYIMQNTIREGKNKKGERKRRKITLKKGENA